MSLAGVFGVLFLMVSSLEVRGPRVRTSAGAERRAQGETWGRVTAVEERVGPVTTVEGLVPIRMEEGMG